MGSSFKNSNNHNQRGNNNSNNNNNKPYALMLLLAFGAAILGVMVLHKLREKRIFSLLVKEKDHELLTLHLLFQREKEMNEEGRKKMEDMKNEVYSLRRQKLEVDRRLSEMGAKKNEIEIVAEGEGKKSNSNSGKVSVLKEMLKKKDEEIDDLKLQLEKIREDVVQSETSNKLVTVNSENENDGDVQLNNSGNWFTDDSTIMGDNTSQNKAEKLNDGVELNKENTKAADYHTSDRNRGTKDREENAKETNTRGRKRRYSNLKRGRRREGLRNRRSGDDDLLYSVRSKPVIVNSNEEQQKFNQAGKNESDITTDSRGREEETEIRGKGGMKMIDNTTEETEHGRLVVSMEQNNKNNNAKINTNDDENNKKSCEGDDEIIISSMEMKKKQEIDNEQGNEIAIEEDSSDDDAETNEPEIDIRRFSESDEESEETETEF